MSCFGDLISDEQSATYLIGGRPRDSLLQQAETLSVQCIFTVAKMCTVLSRCKCYLIQEIVMITPSKNR